MPNYPGTQNTDDNLYIGVNNLSTVLTDNPLTAGATTVNVSDTTGFPTVGIITIELEAIHYTGTTATSFTGCTRGFDGTTGASHPVSTAVFHDIPAAHHNVLKDEIKAISDDLRDAFTSDLDDAAIIAATATDAKERLDHIVTQLKNVTGETDWKTAPADTLSGLSAELVAIQSDLDDAITPAASAADLGVRLNHIATQLKNISGETDWKTVPATALNAMLPLAGGTMSGALAMGSNKITGLGNGTAAQDAAAFGQIYAGFQTPIQGTSNTVFSTTSTSFQTTNLSVNITPGSASRRIKIHISGFLRNNAVESGDVHLTIFRDSTDLANTATEGFARITAGSGTGNRNSNVSLDIIDSPATTSAVNYSVRIRTTNAAATASFGITCDQVIQAEEIAAP